LVLDHEGLAEAGGKLVRRGAHDHVGHAAGGNRHDHPDRAIGIGLGACGKRPDAEQKRRRAGEAGEGHPHQTPSSCGTSRMFDHFSWSATLSRPAFTQASSFSPPGAPETPAAPMTSSPAVIGSAPRAVVKPVRYCAPIAGFFFNRSSISPDGMRKVRAVNAFLKLFSMVCGPVPSPRICTITSPLRPTMVAETL